MKHLISMATQDFQSNPAAARKLVSTGAAPLAEGLDTVQHAVWTTAARAILNLSETYTRN